MSTKQVQAVIDAVSEVLGGDFTPSETVVSDVITKEQKAQVRDIVVSGIINGTVAFNGDHTDETAVKRYVNGMVDNHFRKSRVLNGGGVYKPSRNGSKRDPQLKELTKLLKTLEPGTDNFVKVQEHINARTEQLAEERAARSAASVRSSIDTSILPPEMANLVQQSH